MRCDEKMVATFLKWLNKEKKVTKIIKLKLPDSEHRYSSNFVDEEILKRFQIDELDWLVMDIEKGCIENLGASNANPMVKKLHLYSSGQESQVAQLAEVVGIIKRCQVFLEVRPLSFQHNPILTTTRSQISMSPWLIHQSQRSEHFRHVSLRH